MLFAPDSKFVAVGIGKVKAAPAGKLKGLDSDFSAGSDHLLLGPFQSSGIENDERTSLDGLGAHGESARQPAIVKAGVVWAVVGKAPSEDRSVETFGRLNVAGGKLDVVHLKVMLLLGHLFPRAGISGQD